MDFGSKLRTLRRNAGMTQQQLASRLGITKSVVSYYELQERSPSPDILIKLASTFHVSTDYLLGIERNKTVDLSGLEPEDEKIIYLLVESLSKKSK